MMTWKQYRKACAMSNVEPVRADFMAGEIPTCVQHQAPQQAKALAKAAGVGR